MQYMRRTKEVKKKVVVITKEEWRLCVSIEEKRRNTSHSDPGHMDEIGWAGGVRGMEFGVVG
jgi:hypothetical protein